MSADSLPPELSGGLPLLGHAIEFHRHLVPCLRRGYQELGPLFSIRLGPQRAAVLLGPSLHEPFFAHTGTRLSTHKAYKFLAPLLGEIGLTACAAEYEEQRPFIQAPFKTSKMPAYIEVMVAEATAWLDGLGPSGTLELTSSLTRLVQRVAGRAVMGDSFNETVGTEFWQLYDDMSRGIDALLPASLPLPRFIRRDRARLRAILRPLVAERRRRPGAHDDFAAELIAANAGGRTADDDFIVDLLLALLFAGHETTIGQATWTMVELLRSPAYRRLVEAELDSALGGTELDASVLRRLRHLGWAIQEVERLHPSAPILVRVAEDDVDLGTHRIPAGWLVVASPAVAHRMPEVFTDPDAFDPLRFAPDRDEGRHLFALIGFGGGLRRCPGLNFALCEMTTIAALALRHLDMQLLTASPETVYGQGAARPGRIWITYTRRTPASHRPPVAVQNPHGTRAA